MSADPRRLPPPLPAASAPPLHPRPIIEFDRVYRDHLDFVWRCLRSRGIPDASLEDAAHEVFIVVHRKLGEYDGRAAVQTWIYGIVRKVAANLRRGLERAERRNDRALSEQAVAAGAGHDPEADMHRCEAAALVQEFLDGLETNLREAFFLSQIEGFTGPEIARMTGTNVNTIHARIRASRRRFCQFLTRKGLGPARSEQSEQNPQSAQHFAQKRYARDPLPNPFTTGEVSHG